jgi:hypothetical protein
MRNAQLPAAPLPPPASLDEIPAGVWAWVQADCDWSINTACSHVGVAHNNRRPAVKNFGTGAFGDSGKGCHFACQGVVTAQ